MTNSELAERLPAYGYDGQTYVRFTNERGNVIRVAALRPNYDKNTIGIIVEGPDSRSSNWLTQLEATHVFCELAAALSMPIDLFSPPNDARLTPTPEGARKEGRVELSRDHPLCKALRPKPETIEAIGKSERANARGSAAARDMLVGQAALSPSPDRLAVAVEALREQTDLVDRLCSAVERAEQDIGGESVLTVLKLLGPANDRARTALSSIEGPKE